MILHPDWGFLPSSLPSSSLPLLFTICSCVNLCAWMIRVWVQVPDHACDQMTTLGSLLSPSTLTWILGMWTQIARSEWQGLPPTESPGWSFFFFFLMSMQTRKYGWNSMPACQRQNTVTFKALGFHEKCCSSIPETHAADIDICILACSCWLHSLTHSLQTLVAHHSQGNRGEQAQLNLKITSEGAGLSAAARHLGWQINWKWWLWGHQKWGWEWSKGNKAGGNVWLSTSWWKDTKRNWNLLD